MHAHGDAAAETANVTAGMTWTQRDDGCIGMSLHFSLSLCAMLTSANSKLAGALYGTMSHLAPSAVGKVQLALPLGAEHLQTLT